MNKLFLIVALSTLVTSNSSFAIAPPPTNSCADASVSGNSVMITPIFNTSLTLTGSYLGYLDASGNAVYVKSYGTMLPSSSTVNSDISTWFWPSKAVTAVFKICCSQLYRKGASTSKTPSAEEVAESCGINYQPQS